jgi:hypothetical protein
LVAIVLLSLGLRDALASECIRIGDDVVRASRIGVQVWRRGSSVPVQGAVVTLVWEHGQGVPAATGETDSQGALQIEEVPPGLYSLQVTLSERSPVLFNGKGTVSYDVPVRIVSPTDAPPRLIAIGLGGGLECSTHCAVTGTVGPLAKAPKCAVRR